MKALKIIFGILALLIIVIVIGGYFLFKNLDGIVASAIETYGSEATLTEVKVESVNLTLTEGRGEIHGLSIANPEGFTRPHIFSLNEVALQVEPASLQNDVIVLDEVLIDGAKVTLEHTGVKDTNVQKLMNNIRSSMGGGNEDTSADQPGSSPEPRFMVKRLAFTGISMDVVSPQIDNRTFTLRDIQRSNLGTAQRGLTSKELAMAIAEPLLDEARDKFEEEVKGQVGDALKKKLNENLSDEDKAKLDKYKSLIN